MTISPQRAIARTKETEEMWLDEEDKETKKRKSCEIRLPSLTHTHSKCAFHNKAQLKYSHSAGMSKYLQNDSRAKRMNRTTHTSTEISARRRQAEEVERERESKKKA